MVLGPVVESLVVDKIGVSVCPDKDRLAARRHVGRLERRQVIVAHDLETVVEIIVLVVPGLAGRVHERARRALAPIETHLVAARPGKAAAGDEQVVVAVLLIMENERPLARVMSAADQVIAEIRIDAAFLVRLRMDRKAGLRIDLERKETARPGAVDHPDLPVVIRVDRRVDAVRPLRVVIAAVFIVAGGVRIRS